MVGDRPRLTRSLRFRLSIWLVATSLAVALIAAGVSFVSVYHDANAVQDNVLRQTGALVTRGDLSTSDHSRRGENAKIDFEDRILIRKLRPLAKQSRQPRFKPTLTPGFHTVETSKGAYRVLIRQLPDGTRVAIAQQTAVRNETVFASAVISIVPMLVVSVVFLGVLFWILNRELSPIAQMATVLDNREEADQSPLNVTGLPAELWPFIDAFNRLITRVGQLLSMQQRFIAAAAHELRTPLASLSLQADQLVHDSERNGVDSRDVRALQAGIKRNRRLIDQLLSLSRSQTVSPEVCQPCAIDAVLREVVGELMPLINDRHIDLNVALAPCMRVWMTSDELASVLTNVISNALAHVPESGHIEIRGDQSNGHSILDIEDNGPGLSDQAKRQASEAFFRVGGETQTGAGLGLAIVREIVIKRSGELEFLNASTFDSGLRVRIKLPGGYAV